MPLARPNRSSIGRPAGSGSLAPVAWQVVCTSLRVRGRYRIGDRDPEARARTAGRLGRWCGCPVSRQERWAFSGGVVGAVPSGGEAAAIERRRIGGAVVCAAGFRGGHPSGSRLFASGNSNNALRTLPDHGEGRWRP